MSENHHLHAQVLDSLPVQLAVLDADGTIRYTNRPWRTFGVENGLVTDADLLGVNYLSVCDESDDEDATAVAAGIRAVIAGDCDEFVHEYPCHSPDEHRWFLMRAVRVEESAGSHVLVMHLDITDRKLAELSVRERNEQLDALTGMLAHDLRNPLAVALGRAELIEDADTEALVDALDRMDEIIDDALVLARRTDVEETELVSLDDVAADAWANVETGEVTLSVDGTLAFDADRSLLSQLLENLFRNAVQHGGASVTVGRVGEGFYVADDGPGIPREERESVFDPDYTTHHEGTGLGMSIVERIADAHGWTVSVEESESGGARFEIAIE